MNLYERKLQCELHQALLLPRGAAPVSGREGSLRPEHARFQARAQRQLLTNKTQVATFQAVAKLGSCRPRGERPVFAQRHGAGKENSFSFSQLPRSVTEQDESCGAPEATPDTAPQSDTHAFSRQAGSPRSRRCSPHGTLKAAAG